VFTALAEALMAEAIGQGQNDFKIPLARRAIVRALEQAAGIASAISTAPESRP